jgi:hypothetical protein
MANRMTRAPTLPIPGGGSSFACLSTDRFTNRIQRQEAAARRAMMAGAEGLRRLDFDADPTARAAAIMRAVDDKTPGRDRLQAEETFRHPIFGGDARKAERVGDAGAHGRGRQIAHRRLVNRTAEVERDPPLTLALIHKSHHRLVGKERLGKPVGDALRRLFIGCERRRHSLCRLHRRLIIHGSIDRFQTCTPN